MPVVVNTGPATVVADGTLTLWGSQVDFTLQEPDGGFLLRLRFESDDGDARVETEWDGDVMVLVCRNFDGIEGRGSARPVLLTELGDDLVFFHFRVFLFGKTEDRTVHYTFFRVPKEAVGWTPVDG